MQAPVFVLTISGSDSSGGAGLQADNRAILAAGAFPLNVITAVTLQTPAGVEAVECISAPFVVNQLRRLLDAYPVAAVKSGMLASQAIAEGCAEVLEDFPEIPYVLDPVLLSTSGHPLLPASAVALLRDRLMPRATLTTPNLDELFALAPSAAGADPVRVGLELAKACGQSMLIKGGHRGGDACEDWLLGPGGTRESFTSERINSNNLRGTGCALSSAIAARLAGGYSLSAAVKWAKAMLADSLKRNATTKWTGAGPAML